MKKYCILHEKWIGVVGDSPAAEYISLEELFENSEKYFKLRFNSVREEISVLRLLLGVIHTVVQRYDVDGKESFLNSKEKAIERWAQIWNNGKLPYEVINKYLEQYEDCFYLVHDTNPFMQETWVKEGEKYKLNFSNLRDQKGKVRKEGSTTGANTGIIKPGKFLPSVSRSDNKGRLLSDRDLMKNDDPISLKEALPALLTLHCFDDNAIKPGTGPGWLSLSTTTFIEGKNLFETLMLNLQLVDYRGKVWPKNIPSWELEPNTNIRTEPIKAPDNPAEILTMHYRSARLLVDEEDNVNGVIETSGCYFDTFNVFAEPMKIWSLNSEDLYKMYSVSHTLYSWVDFPFIFRDTSKYIIPSISWLTTLKKYGKLSRQEFFNQSFFDIQYSNMRMSIKDTSYSAMPFYWSNFDKQNDAMINEMVFLEIKNCIDLVNIVNDYFEDLCFSDSYSIDSKNDKDIINDRKKKNSQFVYKMYDSMIRDFIEAISKSNDRFSERDKFRKDLSVATKKYGKDLLGNFTDRVLYGRLQIKKSKGVIVEKKYCSAGKAMNMFHWRINNKLFGDKNE